MKSLFHGAPWPASTIAIISILFTPAVGGIIAGINHRRMGFPERARKDYLLAFAAFALYALYSLISIFFFFDLASEPPPIDIWLLVPTLALVYITIYGAPYALASLIVPSLLIAWLLYSGQQRSMGFVRERPAEHPLPSWRQAYAVAFILTFAVGLLLSSTITALTSEAFRPLIEPLFYLISKLL